MAEDAEGERIDIGQEAPEGWRPDAPGILQVLLEAEVRSVQLAPDGSNYTFYAVLEHAVAGRWVGVYKPQRGEAPLWDFPSGTLYKREYGAYLVSEALGWNFVPPTVVRDGPYDVGTMQLFVPSVQGANYFSFRAERAAELQRMAAFDAFTNNADRKGSHCLLGLDGRLWGIDHGLCFNVEHKLRTVIWDFQGDPVPDHLLVDLRRLLERLMGGGDIAAQLGDLIHQSELDMLKRRLEALVRAGVYPPPGMRRSVPWPPV